MSLFIFFYLGVALTPVQSVEQFVEFVPHPGLKSVYYSEESCQEALRVAEKEEPPHKPGNPVRAWFPICLEVPEHPPI